MHTSSDFPSAPAACRLVLAWLLLFGYAPLHAQAARATSAGLLPVDSVLRWFEADVRTHVVQSSGSRLVYDILDLSHPYLARQDSLLDGLERLALTSTDRNVRQIAAARIAIAGEIGRTAPPRSGVLSRLVRVYRGNSAWLVRSTIMDRIPFLAERRAGAAFLRSIAAEPDTSSGIGPHGYFAMGDPRTEALARLAEMGEEGRAVLQAMHRNRDAHSPQVRLRLENMARRGFPVRDIAPRPHA